MSGGNVRFAYIASLRGIAALAIVAFHSAILPIPSAMPPGWLATYVLSANMAVPLFYALSAFTLALTFERSDRSVANFYLRRFFRIAPLFYLVTAFYIVHFGVNDVRAIIQNFAFIFNFDFSASNYRAIATGGWSIGVEMPFYLAFPLLLRFASTLRRAIVLAAVFLAISFCFRLLVGYAAASDFLVQAGIVPPISYEDFGVESLFGNLPYFGFGFVAYRLVLLLGKLEAGDRTALGCTFVAFAAIGTIALPQLHGTYLENPIPAAHAFAVVFALAICGLAFWPWKAIVNGFTEFCGEISYSLYLMHIVVIRLAENQILAIYAAFSNPLAGYLATFASVAAVSIALAYATYRLIERPGIALGRRLEAQLVARREAKRNVSLARPSEASFGK